MPTATAKVTIAIFALLPIFAEAKDLAEVPNAFEAQIHVDLHSIQRAGNVVTFTYVLGTKPGSNAIDATIDCIARTYSVGRVVIYPGALAEGTPRTHSDPPASEKVMRSIPPRSTWSDLTSFLCV